MKAYGTKREVKSMKTVTAITDKGEETVETYDGSYLWTGFSGEITITLDQNGKHIVLLKLKDGDYNKLMVSVKSGDEIEEIVQKQLEVIDHEDE